MAADQGGRRRIHVEGAGDWQAHAARNPLAPPPSEPAPPATSQAPAPRLSESEQRDALARSQAEVARRVAAVKGRLVAAREGLPPLITSGLEGAARDVAEATRRAADRRDAQIRAEGARFESGEARLVERLRADAERLAPGRAAAPLAAAWVAPEAPTPADWVRVATATPEGLPLLAPLVNHPGLAESRSCTIILIVGKPVWNGLSRLGMSVSLDLPTTDELAATLGGIIDDHQGVVTVEWQHHDLRQAAEILSGVTEMEAVNVLMTLLTKRRLGIDDIPRLSEYKDRIFGEMSGIERIHLKGHYEVGGLKELQRWLVEREVLMKSDLSQTALHPPKGVLLVGVPGCGKSLSAKAIAAEWSLPLYRLDMAGILGMYVGQSESQLRDALETADRVAPCVLWIDEIEKALASGVGDSGTSRRLVGQFLYWLQESTAKVFLVATANDVSSLPPELLRKGRFDEMFFVDLPDRVDREEILSLYFRKLLRTDLGPVLATTLVDLTEGFSGSDIEAVVHDIASHMFAQGTQQLPSEAQIAERFRDVIPYSRSNAEDVAALRAWSSGRCVPAGSPAEGHAYGSQSTRRVVVS